MILVDSCVWIDFLKGKITPQVQFLLDVQRTRKPEICISGVIYFEVLRGIQNHRERAHVKRSLDLLQKHDVMPGSYERMLENDILCRGQGFTLSSVADWLIVQTDRKSVV